MSKKTLKKNIAQNRKANKWKITVAIERINKEIFGKHI